VFASSLASADSFFSELRWSLRTQLFAQRVFVAVTTEGFTCAWSDRGTWYWDQASWPDGSTCGQGCPKLPAAMAELIADFLLDLDIAGARVELLLPLEMCEWRVLDHVHGCIDICDFDQIVLQSIPWSHDSSEYYVAHAYFNEIILLVAVRRTALQSWIDVFNRADLFLQRVDWLLSAAWRGLLQQLSLKDHDFDLAWLVSHSNQDRLILLRSGVPEVDRLMVGAKAEIETLMSEIIRAWHGQNSRQHVLIARLSTGTISSLKEIDFDYKTIEWIPTMQSQLIRYDSSHLSNKGNALDPLISLGFAGLGSLATVK